MKKFVAVLCAATLLLLSTAGCASPGNSSSQESSKAESSAAEESFKSEESSAAEESSKSEESSAAEESSKSEESFAAGSEYTVRVAALKGPTGMGLAKLISENETGTSQNQYDFTMASSPDEILASIIKGDFDIAAVPTNVASILYNKTEGKVQMAALNTLGVLYVLTTDDSIETVADLAGKTVYSTGQGAVPEIVFNYI